MPYKPIESYGVIGNLRSVALVGIDGAIDFCCLPRFDSPSIFAAILDEKKGGTFRIASTSDHSSRQMYLPDTNVLVTRFLSNEGVGEVIDFMPVIQDGQGGDVHHEIIRIVRSVRGVVHFSLDCFPALDFARKKHEVILERRGAIVRAPGGFQMGLLSPVPLRQAEGGRIVAEFKLNQEERAAFCLRLREDGDTSKDILERRGDGSELLDSTITFWRRWIARCRYRGRWREMVSRSVLMLKMLTYQPTGAMVAAPTCSLPEEVGGVRNWDYRYTWIRDAAFTVYAFIRLGYTEEAARFMDWLQARVHEEEHENGPLNIMYGIDGRHDLVEEELDHLEGYRGSKPVRVGNAAYDQLQLDIYGELTDSIYLYDKHGTPISYDLWNKLRRMLDWVSHNWNQPDEGIWEVRGGRQHFVYSKMQCWVALDRGLRMSLKRGLPMERERLGVERDRIYELIMKEGYNPKINTFTQSMNSDAVDASNLLMPMVKFLAPTDPRMLGTLDATMEELVSDSLVHRYKMHKGASDGLSGEEGTFSMCTFWLVEALGRAGRIEEARFIFEKMLTYANHVGLYAEEIGPRGEALGNFPQAFTHLGLISAAFDLDRRLGSQG